MSSLYQTRRLGDGAFASVVITMVASIMTMVLMRNRVIINKVKMREKDKKESKTDKAMPNDVDNSLIFLSAGQ